MASTPSFYSKNSDELASQYNALDFEKVHSAWKAHWPMADEIVLDVGAGSGRDAKWMSEQGADVYALEPCDELREIGCATTGPNVTWIDDELPSLNRVQGMGIRFDLILVSAVWMHLAPTTRARAFRKLSNLLAPNGRLVITLRHGGFDDGRVGYEVSVAELEQFAKDTALLVKTVRDADDQMKRSQIYWQTIVFSLPDDGSHMLPRRPSINSDSKRTCPVNQE